MNLSQFKQSPHASAPHFALLGKPVAHSFSPLMHNTAAAYHHITATYHAIRLESDEIPMLTSFLDNPKFCGANVTIPYKKIMLDHVDQIDAKAQQIGAINTIVKQKKQLVGYNTDVGGFVSPLEPFSDALVGGQAIVFGTGGAARAIVFGLMELGLRKIWLVSRTPHQKNQPWPKEVEVISYDKWPEYVHEVALVVNATPLGMTPDKGRSPVKPSEINYLRDKICYDIVYHPVETTFLKQARGTGARTIGGLEMLIQQGSRSFELWTGQPFPIKKVRQKIMQQIAYEH